MLRNDDGSVGRQTGFYVDCQSVHVPLQIMHVYFYIIK